MASLSRTNGVERAPDASVTLAKKWDIGASVTLTFDASVTREFFTLGNCMQACLCDSLSPIQC